MSEHPAHCAAPTPPPPEASAPPAPGAPSTPSTGLGAAPAAPSPKPTVATWKLIAVLAGGGAIAGLLLVVAYLWTLEPIRAHRAKVLAEGIREVLGMTESEPYESFWLVDGALTAKEPADHRPADLWRGRHADGTVAGWAIDAKESGFSDDIHLIFGWDAKAKRILAMKVLEQKETPGLGDEIQNDPSFVKRFAGRAAPVRGVKRGQGTGAATEVDTITGATISSRAVIRIVNHAVERWGPKIDVVPEEAPR